jgi:hypothetical protein
MSARAKLILWSSTTLVLVGGLLLFGGCLSTPRDFSSPQATIRLVDESGSPVKGIEVGRSWYDSDRSTDGHDTAVSDQGGIAQFSKVSASVGLFTGTGRKVGSFFAICGSGSGTSTEIYVRYHGLCKVAPKGKTFHPVGQSNQDPDGVWFYTSTDSQGNTMANLTFPQKITNIDYVLMSSKLHQ